MAPRWIAFIRAINGSPHNRVKMVDLASWLGAAGCADVSWHLQTGNMFFHSARKPGPLADAIRSRLEAEGLRACDVFLWRPADLSALVARSPFAGLDADAYQFEAAFLHHAPATRDSSTLRDVGATITYADDTVACFAFPRGGRMQGGFNGWIERQWKVPATSRAWNVVEAVAAKAAAR